MKIKRGIVPKIYGGLGNQLFIVVAAWIVGRVKGCPVYIPRQQLDKNKHNRCKNDYYSTILKYFGEHLPMNEEEVLLAVSQQGWNLFNQEGFHPWNPEMINPGTILHSYFQFYPPFVPFEKEIRELMLKGLFEGIGTACAGVKEQETALLHIRRGDYLAIPHFHFIQPISYYQLAVSQLLEKNPEVKKILVFSDDISWVKEQEFFRANPLMECVENENELECLGLMAKCRAGAICANSTFSWWGAFLGAYAERSPIFVPKFWINMHVYDLFPKEWIIL